MGLRNWIFSNQASSIACCIGVIGIDFLVSAAAISDLYRLLSCDVTFCGAEYIKPGSFLFASLILASAFLLKSVFSEGDIASVSIFSLIARSPARRLSFSCFPFAFSNQASCMAFVTIVAGSTLSPIVALDFSEAACSRCQSL